MILPVREFEDGEGEKMKKMWLRLRIVFNTSLLGSSPPLVNYVHFLYAMQKTHLFTYSLIRTVQRVQNKSQMINYPKNKIYFSSNRFIKQNFV